MAGEHIVFVRPTALFVGIALAGLAATTSAAAPRSASCEWRSPAADPYTGDVPGAVDDYTDIPASTRARLKARMERQAYDDVVVIRPDAIEGGFAYDAALLDMHFGQRRLCGKVTRRSWKPDHQERALAYCEDGHCVVVPLVCRNVSRVIRHPATAMGGPAGGSPPLVFDAPSAGLPPGQPPTPDGPQPTSHPLLAPPASVTRLPPQSDVPPAPTPLPPLPPSNETPAPPGPPAAPVPPPSLPPVVTPPPVTEVPAPPPPAEPPFIPPTPQPGMPPLPPAPAVPEPASWALWAAGLAAAVAWRKRRRGAWNRFHADGRHGNPIA
ncbi:MAG TPA: MHFG family PEP-CTERM protein [Roseateles sp.]